MGDASEFIVVRHIGNCLKADPSMARAWQPRLASRSKKSRNEYIIDIKKSVGMPTDFLIMPTYKNKCHPRLLFNKSYMD
jgi:hypothetical protein